MQYEYAKVSRTGHRSENQDRVDVVAGGASALMVVVDGMGGHAEGAKAAELTVDCLKRRFKDVGQPVLDPQGFLIAALAAAHDEVVGLGAGIAVEHRPRATCAVCLVQDGNTYCAHIGDSRIYHLRDTGIVGRSRDHSHVELLLHEGVIDEDEVSDHPMRNLVECCLGGDEWLPDMSIAPRGRLSPGDIVLICTDGLWTGVSNEELMKLAGSDADLDDVLAGLADAAVDANAPGSDNTSAAVLRFDGAAA